MSIANMKLEAKRIVYHNQKFLVPVFLFIGIVASIASFFEGSFIEYLCGIVFLCMDYGMIMACRKAYEHEGSQVAVCEEGIVGLKKYPQLFSTYFFYQFFLYVAILLAFIVLGIIAVLAFHDEFQTVVEYIAAFITDGTAAISNVADYTALTGIARVFSVGFIVLVIPLYLIYMITFSGAPYAIAMGKKGLSALRYSFNKIKGHRLELCRIYLSYVPIMIVISLGVSMFESLLYALFDNYAGIVNVVCTVFSTYLAVRCYSMNMHMQLYIFYLSIFQEEGYYNRYDSRQDDVIDVDPEPHQEYNRYDGYDNDYTNHNDYNDYQEYHMPKEETLEFEEISTRKLAIGCLTYLPFYFIFASYVLSAIFLAIPYFRNMTNVNEMNAYYNLFYDGVLVIIGVLCFREFFVDIFHRVRKAIKENFAWFSVKAYALLYATNFVTSLLVAFILGSSESSANQSGIETIMDVAPVIMFICVVFVAPILEELVFRGLIFRVFRNKSVIAAHAISAFLFGFMHCAEEIIMYQNFSEVVQMLPYIAMGLVFSLAYEKYKTIGVPIYMHMLNNFVACLVILLV